MARKMPSELSPEQRLAWWYSHAANATSDEVVAMWAGLSKDERRYLWANFTSEDRMRLRTANTEQGGITSEGLQRVLRWVAFVGMVLLFLIVFAAFW